jgi:secreted trypsin-like serine protease
MLSIFRYKTIYKGQSRLILAFIMSLIVSVFNVSCSSESDSSSIKLIGGENSGSAPFMATLYSGILDSTPVCGGALISEDIVITAAKCVQKHKIKSVVIGDNHTSIKVPVIATISHPEYVVSKNIPSHNIALIKIDKTQFPTYYRPQPIKILNTENISNSYRKFFLYGRGNRSSYGKVASKDLQKFSSPIVNSFNCKNAYSKIYGDRTSVSDDQICSGYEHPVDQGTCTGDLGGPLVFNSQRGPMLVGVLSHGDSCSRLPVPNIITKADFYYPWLSEIVTKLSDKDVELNTESLKFHLTRYCNISTETSNIEKFDNGFVNTIKTYDLNKFKIEEVAFSKFIEGTQQNTCSFLINNQQNAVYEFRKKSDNTINGVITVGQRKWIITPRETTKKLLSCTQNFKNIDIEWYENEPVSKVYTDQGEYYAHPHQITNYSEKSSCYIGSYALRIAESSTYGSNINFLIASGPGITETTYYINQNKETALDAKIVRKENSEFNLIITNNLGAKIYGLELTCDFPFKATNRNNTFTAILNENRDYAVFFGKENNSLWGLGINTTREIKITSPQNIASPICKLNGRPVGTSE